MITGTVLADKANTAGVHQKQLSACCNYKAYRHPFTVLGVGNRQIDLWLCIPICSLRTTACEFRYWRLTTEYHVTDVVGGLSYPRNQHPLVALIPQIEVSVAYPFLDIIISSGRTLNDGVLGC